jgi:hypothetical protein
MNTIKDDSSKDLLHTAESMKRMNFSEEDEKSKEDPIDATDQSRIEEREQRIASENDTARLRTEKGSVEDSSSKNQ